MGDVTLGALLGANQSFEAPSLAPWSKTSDQASAFIVSSATAIHSSHFGLFTATGSSGDTLRVIAYTHGTSQDAARVAFPDIASHAVHSSVWGRAQVSASSGQALWRVTGSVEGQSVPIAYSESLQRYEAVTWTHCPGAGLESGLNRIVATGPVASFCLDDVLTRMDALILHPEWTLEDQSALLQAQHRTQSGRLQAATWGRYRAVSLPLRWLSDLEADLVNWWWERQFPLALTLDTSDSAAVLVGAIANSRQPIGQRIRPYGDRWTGTVNLESLDDGSLIF